MSELYEHAARPHERRDASLRTIAQTAGCIAALIIAALVVSWLLWNGREAALRRSPSVGSFRHGPAEVPDIVKDWAALDRENRQNLETYGWVDRKAGVVRIPIEQAMKRLAAPHSPP